MHPAFTLTQLTTRSPAETQTHQTQISFAFTVLLTWTTFSTFICGTGSHSQVSSYQWGLLSFSPHSSTFVLTSIWYSIYSLVHLFNLFSHSPTQAIGASALPVHCYGSPELKINTDWVTDQMGGVCLVIIPWVVRQILTQAISSKGDLP